MKTYNYPKLDGVVLPAEEFAKIFHSLSEWRESGLLGFLTCAANRRQLCWFDSANNAKFWVGNPNDYISYNLTGDWALEVRNKYGHAIPNIIMKHEGDLGNKEVSCYVCRPDDGSFRPRKPVCPADSVGILVSSEDEIVGRFLQGVDVFLEDVVSAKQNAGSPHAQVAYTVCVKLLELVQRLNENSASADEVVQEINDWMIAHGFFKFGSETDLKPVVVGELTQGHDQNVDWRVGEEDFVSKGQIIGYVRYDSGAFYEYINSPCDGRIAGLVKWTGSVLSAGEVIAYIAPAK